jgi:hypothetical protein
MRWSPIIRDLAIVIAAWTAVLWTIRQRGARVAANPSPRAVQGHRLYTVAALCVMVGATWFVAWLITDSIGPHWLHTLSMPAALVFIAVGALLSGYAGWVGGP